MALKNGDSGWPWSADTDHIPNQSKLPDISEPKLNLAWNIIDQREQIKDGTRDISIGDLDRNWF